MDAKSAKYSSKEDVDELESISDKLALDLRKSIKQLENFPALSDPWLQVADIFGRIANISDVESRLSQGKKDATLWETEEQALRFLMEDGKLNLCLRCLTDFKATQIQQRKDGDGAMLLMFSCACDKFEKGLGAILRNAWMHVEVLQTTDLFALISHIADVLEAVVISPDLIEAFIRNGDCHQRQEFLVFQYITGILQHVEEIGEIRVMSTIRERRVFMLGVHVLVQMASIREGAAPKMQKIHLVKIAEALALLTQTEDFGTYRSQYHNSGTDLEKLIELKDTVLPELIAEPENKKLLRPLIDSIDKAKRLARAK